MAERAVLLPETVMIKQEPVETEADNNVSAKEDERWILPSSFLEPIVKIEPVEEEYHPPDNVYHYHSSYVQEQYHTDLNNISLKIEPEVIIKEEEGKEVLINEVPNKYVEPAKEKSYLHTSSKPNLKRKKKKKDSCKLVPVIIDGREIRLASIGGSSPSTAASSSSKNIPPVNKPAQIAPPVIPQTTTSENDSSDSPQPIFCHECFQMFLNAEDLRNHLPEHVNDRPFKCEDCGKRFYLSKDLRRHLNRGHKYLPIKVPVHTQQPVRNPTQTFVCKICDIYFANTTEVKSHFSEHIKPKPYVCHLCGDANSSLDMLAMHMQKIHKRAVYFSETNPYRHPKNMSFQSALISSTVTQTPSVAEVLNVNPPVIEESENNDTNLDTNLVPVIVHGREIKLAAIGESSNKSTAISSDPETFTSKLRSAKKEYIPASPSDPSVLCVKCRVSFPNAEALRSHLPEHDRARRFQCDICDTKFMLKEYLIRHMLRGHDHFPIRVKPKSEPVPPPEPSYVCQICKVYFHTNTDLRNHFSEHIKGKPFVCHICGKACTTLVILNQHMLQSHNKVSIKTADNYEHEKYPQFVKIVPKPTPQVTTPQIISKINPQIIPLVIPQTIVHPIAPQIIPQKNPKNIPLKKVKVKVKNKNDEYECEACIKTFKDIEGLEEHEKIHEIIQPQICPLCGMTMFTKHTLKAHVTAVHKQRIVRSKQPRFSSLHLA